MTGTMRGLCAFACVAMTSVGWSCAGDEDEPMAQFAEPCDGNCAEGMECLGRICTARCSDGDVNACSEFSDTAICTAGYCYEGCETTRDCPNDLVCTMALQIQGTCRVQ